MRKLLLASALAMSATFFSNAALAADSSFYLRGNVSQADYGDFGGYIDDEKDTALGINFGWRFLPWLAVEAGYNDFGAYQTGCGGPVCPAVVFPKLNVDSVELGLAARVPFGEGGWFGQARLGMHRWDVGYGGSENDPYYGVGVGYAFTDRFSLGLNYDRYRTNDFDLDRVGLGFEISF